MLRVGTQILSEMRVGTQKIKEAWVGATKVFSSFVPFIGTLLAGANWAVEPASDPTFREQANRVFHAGDKVIFEKGSIGGNTITAKITLVTSVQTGQGLDFSLYDGDTLIEHHNIITTSIAGKTQTIPFNNNISNYSLQISRFGTAAAASVRCGSITIS